MKRSLNRRQILEIGVATDFLNNVIERQTVNPEGMKKAGFEIRLPNKTMYRIGRNMDKIQKPFERIVKSEKEMMEKHKAKYVPKLGLCFETAKEEAGKKVSKPEEKATDKDLAKTVKEALPEGEAEKTEVNVYRPDKEKAEAYIKEWEEFLDDKSCTEEFDFMEVTEGMFEGGTGLTWNNFFGAYSILMPEEATA